MPEEAPRVSFLTKEQVEKKHQKAAFLYSPLTFEGGLIKNSIIDQNKLAAETNPRISDLIGLYVRLKEYELTGASPTSQLASEWVSLVAYSCEFILREGKHQSAESFKTSRRMFEDIYKRLRDLSNQRPRHLFKSLAFLIEKSLKEKVVNFSTDEIERRLRLQYKEHKEIEDSVKMDTFLPWVVRGKP